MSLTHKIEPGATKSWLHTGGDEPLVLTSLADNAARQGDYLDLGTSFAEMYGFRLTVTPAAAPTLASLVRLAFGFSPATTGFPGGLTGADAALANPAKVFPQLNEMRPLILIDATGAQVITGTFRPSARYAAPAVWLDAIGQALSSTGTDHKLEVWPLTAVTE